MLKPLSLFKEVFSKICLIRWMNYCWVFQIWPNLQSLNTPVKSRAITPASTTVAVRPSADTTFTASHMFCLCWVFDFPVMAVPVSEPISIIWRWFSFGATAYVSGLHSEASYTCCRLFVCDMSYFCECYNVFQWRMWWCKFMVVLEVVFLWFWWIVLCYIKYFQWIEFSWKVVLIFYPPYSNKVALHVMNTSLIDSARIHSLKDWAKAFQKLLYGKHHNLHKRLKVVVLDCILYLSQY